MSVPNIQVFGKPMQKLIETVSKHMGIRYKPTAIRNEADAKAYEIVKIAEAQAKASIIKADAKNEIADRARERLYNQEMQRQINIENIVEKAAPELLDEVSETPVDEQWRTNFFNLAQDISSESLQGIWSKILAEEINQPGTISVRTLDVLSKMSKSEAQKFEILSKISTRYGNIFKIDNLNLSIYGITYDDLCLLRGAGLLLASDTMNVTYQTNYQIDENGQFGALLSFHEKKFLFVTKEINTDPTNKFSFEQFKLTLAGVELLPIIGQPVDMKYLNDFQNFLDKRRYVVKMLDVGR